MNPTWNVVACVILLFNFLVVLNVVEFLSSAATRKVATPIIVHPRPLVTPDPTTDGVSPLTSSVRDSYVVDPEFSSLHPSFPFLGPETSHYKNLHVLFVCLGRYYYERMDQFFVYQYEGAKNHSQVGDAQLWALDTKLNGYDPDKTLADNVESVYKSAGYFDIVSIVHEIQYMPSDELCELHKRAGGKTVLVWYPHETRNTTYVHIELGKNCLDAVAFPYPNEMQLFASLSHKYVFFMLPFGADPTMFLNTTNSKGRRTDILLAGNRNKYYPLRQHFDEVAPKLITKLNLTSIFTAKTVDNWLFKRISTPSEQRAASVKQTQQWADLLATSKICLIGPSLYGYAVMKYTEMALSGCFLMGGLPHSMTEIWRNFVVDVSMDNLHVTDINGFEKKLRYWMEHDEEREYKTTLAQKFVLKYLTWERTFDYVIHAYHLVQHKQHGMYFYFGHEHKCRPIYDTELRLVKNPLCSVEVNKEFEERVPQPDQRWRWKEELKAKQSSS